MWLPRMHALARVLRDAHVHAQTELSRNHCRPQRIDIWQQAVDTDVFHPAFRSEEMRARMSGGKPDLVILTYVGRLGAGELFFLLSVHAPVRLRFLLVVCITLSTCVDLLKSKAGCHMWKVLCGRYDMPSRDLIAMRVWILRAAAPTAAEKNLEALKGILERLPSNAVLCFVGDGPSRPDLAKHFEGLPVYFTVSLA